MSIKKANIRVKIGEKPDIEIALVTLMRKIPSIQSIFDKPNKTKPFINKKIQVLPDGITTCSPKIYASKNRNGVAIKVL